MLILAVNNCAAITVTAGLIVYPYPGSVTSTVVILPSLPILTVACAVVPPPYEKLPGISAGGGSISKKGLWKNLVVLSSTSTYLTLLTVFSG